MKFSVQPGGGESAFDQWKDAMKAVARLPLGIPDEFRKKVWLNLADHHIAEMKIDWDKTVKFSFNERSNPDDNKLGLQIVKDLHRTGCSGYSGEDSEAERALLKRILLAYARWNKAVGYCQGFNVIAALLLDVMDRKEADALKVMIYLIDHVLPQGYFANNLRALSVDMAVFRDLLKVFPKLSRHLDYLQHAQDQSSGGCYEPPLTNVFTMQWFLTLFATCLPKSTVLRVWDSILLDGSEILLRTALVIWGKLSSRILTVSSADEFYTLMGDITQELLEGNILEADNIIKSIYSIAPFPLPQLTDLREKYTYNIRPFSSSTKKTLADGTVLPSDEDDVEDDDLENIHCFTGFIPTGMSSGGRHKGLEGDQRTASFPDISSLGPGAYNLGPVDGSGGTNIPAYMERMSTDISALKKQYTRLRQRQNQAHVIITAATARHQATRSRPMMPTIETPTAMNHLFLNKQDMKGRNRFVAAGPRIANIYPNLSPTAKGQKPGAAKRVQPVGKCKWVQKSPAKQITKAEEVDKTRVQSTPPDDAKHSAVDKSESEEPEEAKGCSSDTVEENKSDKTVEEMSESGNESKDINRSCVQVVDQIDKCAYKTTTNTNEATETAELKECESTTELAESDHEFKRRPSPLYHNDSGLGTSLNSPVGSSTETSPQHVNQNVNHIEVNNDLLNEETLTLCSEISSAWTTDRNSESETQSNRNSAADSKAESEVKEGTVENVIRNNNGARSEVNAELELKVESVGNDAKDKQENGKNSKMPKENCSRETEISSGGSTDQSQGPSHIARGNHEIKIDIQTDDSNRVSKHSSDKGSRESRVSRNSSNSSSSAISVSDSNSYPEVFSPDATSNLTSFQQYYINKRNLDGGAAKALESQVKKSQMPKKLFNPFPVKHVNQNRAKTGIKLGLYKQSTLEEFERNLKGNVVWGK